MFRHHPQSPLFPYTTLFRSSISTAEVNEIEHRGVQGDLALFRVGRVLEADKHPDADRLQLCRVDVGEDKPYQIVCGAWKDRKSTRLNSSHRCISYAVFCLKK